MRSVKRSPSKEPTRGNHDGAETSESSDAAEDKELEALELTPEEKESAHAEWIRRRLECFHNFEAFEEAGSDDIDEIMRLEHLCFSKGN